MEDSQSATRPHLNQQGSTNIIANGNKASGERTQQAVANGWGYQAGSKSIQASDNTAEDDAQQQVANAKEAPMSRG